MSGSNGLAEELIRTIQSDAPEHRNRSLDTLCAEASAEDLLTACLALDRFRRTADNLYERVRALFFLHSIHRFHLPSDRLSTNKSPKKESPANEQAEHKTVPARGLIPFEGHSHLLSRRFEEAIDRFLTSQERRGPSHAISSALASAYRELAFQTLADQVRHSVRSIRGNQWMFRIGHPEDQPLRIRRELLERDLDTGPFPVLRESTPVRMDLSHSGWSDVFFLGMDYPEGARVLNISVDLGVRGRDPEPRPPIEAWLRVIDEPVLRLTSVDLATTTDLNELAEVFDFAKDHLGLLKAAVIAAGIVPPGCEGSGVSLRVLLARLCGEGRGLELCSIVHNIPKGSRLAVSTNLLAALIAVQMRATGQAKTLTGPLKENERRIVAARAILGEWLGGSGGGWQDSGGVWPAIKLITGRVAEPTDPEYGTSRGRLLPDHELLEVPPKLADSLQHSLVLVHGGMAQNVGPVLEMVTEKYLLRSEAEWKGRKIAIELLEELRSHLANNDITAIADLTTRNFEGPITDIIPWATNEFTERVIERTRARFGDGYLGFCMLGGMSGGGMGFWFEPSVHAEAREAMQGILLECKRELQTAMPFAMDPVVYDFAINPHGTRCDLMPPPQALLPQKYYELVIPNLLRNQAQLTPARRRELELVGTASRDNTNYLELLPALFDRVLPKQDTSATHSDLDAILHANGFDKLLHESIRSDLRNGLIGLSQNRLPANTTVEDVSSSDVLSPDQLTADDVTLGQHSIAAGEVAVVTLAAGAASRWTQGAGVVKALNPFCKLGGAHRSFIDVHLAKTRHSGRSAGLSIPHIFTTSFFTHDAIAQTTKDRTSEVPIHLSRSRSVGLRTIPMVRDLRFAWEERAQQQLDEQAQKVQDSLHAALIDWAKQCGEASDYTDNLPLQCLHPVGHWFEIPGLLRNGTLKKLLDERPQLRHLLLHNIDTLGANLDPALLGAHLRKNSCLSFEVIPRRIEDIGGGLARVDGRPRLVEGLAMSREEDEFKLSYYNSLTTWIDIDKLLAVFRLDRDALADDRRVERAIRDLGARLPTYVTIKEVKKRWGHGQEDVFPVTQFEKLWGDMTTLAEVDCTFFEVDRKRGQQLKDPSQLDGWLRDGSAAYIESICEWE